MGQREERLIRIESAAAALHVDLAQMFTARLSWARVKMSYKTVAEVVAKRGWSFNDVVAAPSANVFRKTLRQVARDNYKIMTGFEK